MALFSMKLDNLQQLFVKELRDLYDAETQITDALPKMIDHTHNPQLKQALQEHLSVTKQQISRLDRIFQMLGEKPTGETCKGMKGVIKEGDEIVSAGGDPSTVDAGIISAAQRVEHYEMAGYGTVRTYAKLLGQYGNGKAAAADAGRRSRSRQQADRNRQHRKRRSEGRVTDAKASNLYLARAPHNRGPVFVNDVGAVRFASSSTVRRLRWFSRCRCLVGRRRIGVLQLGQRLVHPRLEVALVIVLPTAVVRYHLHFTACALRYQRDVILALQQRSRDVDVSGVLRVVVSVHLGIVRLR